MKFCIFSLFITILFSISSCSESAKSNKTADGLSDIDAVDADTTVYDIDSTTGDIDSKDDADLFKPENDSISDNDISPENDPIPDEEIIEEKAEIQGKINGTAVFETTIGNIVMGFYGDDMPVTTANFVRYVEDGFFDGLIFHRIIPGFMMQGGGYLPDFTQKTGYDPISFESTPEIIHLKYTISMARTDFADSATSEFFIMFTDEPRLDTTESEPGYAAFGVILDGTSVVQSAEKVKTHNVNADFEDVPVDAIIITKAYMETPFIAINDSENVSDSDNISN